MSERCYSLGTFSASFPPPKKRSKTHQTPQNLTKPLKSPKNIQIIQPLIKPVENIKPTKFNKIPSKHNNPQNQKKMQKHQI